jgi:hypothetical protein
VHPHICSGDLRSPVCLRKEVGSELFHGDGNVDDGGGGNENGIQARLFSALIWI